MLTKGFVLMLLPWEYCFPWARAGALPPSHLAILCQRLPRSLPAFQGLPVPTERMATTARPVPTVRQARWGLSALKDLPVPTMRQALWGPSEFQDLPVSTVRQVLVGAQGPAGPTGSSGASAPTFSALSDSGVAFSGVGGDLHVF